MLNYSEGFQESSLIIDNIDISFFYDYKPEAAGLIVFIHGLGCSKDTFRYVFDKEYFPDMSILIPDLAGFGKSSKPDDFSYSIEDHAVLIEKLISYFPVDNLHIAAHSMGTAVALLFSPGLTEKTKSFANAEGNLVKEDCGLLSRGVAETPFDLYKNKMFLEQQEEFKNNKQLRLHESTAAAMHRSADSLVKWSGSGELLDRFENLDCKKCYIWGEENYNMPVLDMLGKIPKIMIHNSGHGMMTDNPEEYYITLANFINS
jgi:pimeloyl-ACP methyl ester carboxylesterase